MGMHKLFNDDYSGESGKADSYNSFKCRVCGSIGEEKFSWDGKCLMCEEGDNDSE